MSLLGLLDIGGDDGNMGRVNGGRERSRHLTRVFNRAYPSFQRKFGEYQGEEDGWQVSAPWQAGLKNASTIGTIFGAILNGWATSRWGYRKVLTASMVAMNAFSM